MTPLRRLPADGSVLRLVTIQSPDERHTELIVAVRTGPALDGSACQFRIVASFVPSAGDPVPVPLESSECGASGVPEFPYCGALAVPAGGPWDRVEVGACAPTAAQHTGSVALTAVTARAP